NATARTGGRAAGAWPRSDWTERAAGGGRSVDLDPRPGPSRPRFLPEARERVHRVAHAIDDDLDVVVLSLADRVRHPVDPRREHLVRALDRLGEGAEPLLDHLDHLG